MLVLSVTLFTFALLFAADRGWRDMALRAYVLFGVVLTLLTELLGAGRLLSRVPLLLAWGLILLTAVRLIALRGRILSWYFNQPFRSLRVSRAQPGGNPAGRINIVIAAGIAVISVITSATAIVSPPNGADAMAYHMPRVAYWAQSGSVSFFPASYYAQISLQPLAEYFTLHTYLLSGSDRFANIVQWVGSLGCLIGVSLIAGLFGARSKGQLIAALFCATLPNGILQASGAKNDYLLALWLVAMCYFGLRYTQRFEHGDLVAMSAALGLALLTKATAYLFAPAMLLGILRVRALRAVPLLAAGALLLNTPHYWRNFEFSGSPLGYDSAHGDSFFRWPNETFGWRQTVSNILRNLSEQLGMRSPVWNQKVYDTVLRAHAWMGIDPNDPATTWRWTRFAPPKNTNHEADANNRWHGLLLIGAFSYFAWRRERLEYMLAIPLAFLLFCVYLKWQPFLARMFLPLFVLGAPLAGLALEKLRPHVLQMIVCLFLLNNSRPYLFENWVRPWKGPNSIFKTPRERQYFNDMDQWGNRASYERAVDLLANVVCNLVGIDTSQFPIEYPFQALLRKRKPQVRFVHVGVDNATRRYESASAPCAILCMNCAGVEERVGRYRALGPPLQIDRFLLFLGPK